MSAGAGSSRRRPPSRAGSSSTTSSYRDRSPVSRASAPASDGSEAKESMQVGGRTEAEEEGEGEPPPANPIAAMSAEERLATKKKRVRPSAATRTVAAVDQLKACSEEHMAALMQQEQRACEERERARQSHRELMERALGFQERTLEVQERAVQNQERAIERADQHHESTVQEQR
ncbi:caldesmon-like [Sceloporus undulatus]|uniref:caldesmon-like n=1 Tax=Sceloporus undulatus TaxID=8520 RepID=UPI001C4C198B|nr:caldesmon-like [Sceloporus undulatus]